MSDVPPIDRSFGEQGRAALACVEMSDEKQRREGELRVVASATGEPEADLICQRLAAVGITAIAQRSIGGPGFGPSGARDIYVLEDEVERARETLGT